MAVEYYKNYLALYSVEPIEHGPFVDENNRCAVCHSPMQEMILSCSENPNHKGLMMDTESENPYPVCAVCNAQFMISNDYSIFVSMQGTVGVTTEVKGKNGAVRQDDLEDFPTSM